MHIGRETVSLDMYFGFAWPVRVLRRGKPFESLAEIDVVELLEGNVVHVEMYIRKRRALTLRNAVMSTLVKSSMRPLLASDNMRRISELGQGQAGKLARAQTSHLSRTHHPDRAGGSGSGSGSGNSEHGIGMFSILN
ncbi:uncharacterized protein MYCFIDRAFT_208697 [Pseudocercospora fijiensis CIRAD86]|uniref:Uncharacterized protein n=1 Tax=Pseudocercospora fijiensis (strain CIRAD86) TaxID=383855 RepID=M3ANW7_PSEFD|nr:uncharacterized protein MYCFIDRAFT_208697 [Pseudocercospora fijiensis CIRAD86]EME79152.1 hypothetical protein MYCFIDRAFT_208697 [Pseudocercospora fijiensis CIRAD86]